MAKKEYRGYEKCPPEKIAIISMSQGTESRYAIVDADTGEVFDDAQGYGYKSEEKAISAYRYGVFRRTMYVANQKGAVV